MIFDKLGSLLLFTDIPVPQQAWESCIGLLATAATGDGQPGRAMARRRSQEPQKAGQPLLLCKSPAGSLHTSAKLWQWGYRALCPSTPLLIPFREN